MAVDMMVLLECKGRSIRSMSTLNPRLMASICYTVADREWGGFARDAGGQLRF